MVDLRPGTPVADGFLVEGKLYEDDTSIVFGALDPQRSKRAAVRVLTALTPDVRFLGRFARAKEIVSRHVPQLFDIGTLPDGRAYVMMEYLAGESLAKLLARRVLAVAEAVDCVLQACDAVAAAHKLGLVHRKLRTSALFLATGTTGGEPVVKVLNFGTALPATSEAPLKSLRAVNYFAPEQISDPQHADARCDIWALGVILYELLTRQRPFDARSAAAAQKRILKEAPKAPTTLRPDVPPALEQVVFHTLQKDPKRRLQTVADLVDALVPFAGLMRGASATVARTKREGTPSKQPPVRTSYPPADDGEAPTKIKKPMAAIAVPEPEEAGFRKVTSDGRIVSLDSDAAAVAVRSRRVAAEAAALAKSANEAFAALAKEEDGEHTDHTGKAKYDSLIPRSMPRPGKSDRPRRIEELATPEAPAPPPPRKSLARVFIIVLLLAIVGGVGAGLVVRKARFNDGRGGGAAKSSSTTNRSRSLP